MTRMRSEWKRTIWGLVVLLLLTGSAAAIWIHHVWSHSDRLLEQVVRAHLDRLTPGINVIEASAGTGKTHQIGNLVLRLVAEYEISIDRIMVVTFTNAATADSRTTRPSSLPRADSQARSGWGMSPTTFRLKLHTPAIAPSDPFGLASSVADPSGSQ